MFHRTDGDGFRFAKLGEESAASPAELRKTTRQQNTHDAVQVGRNVLPVVHDSNPYTGNKPCTETNLIETMQAVQQFFAQFQKSFATNERKSSDDRFWWIPCRSVLSALAVKQHHQKSHCFAKR